MALEHERVRLVTQVRGLACERENVLDRAVVEVEPEAHQPLLAHAHECALARGMGVPAARATDADSFVKEFSRALAEPGPALIEAWL